MVVFEVEGLGEVGMSRGRHAVVDSVASAREFML